MARKNGTATTFSGEDLADIRGSIEILAKKLAPYLQNLSAEDRRELPKMGDKTVSFVQKAYEYASKNKELAPPYLDIKELEGYVKAVAVLRELSQGLTPITDALHDTLALAGSESYKGGLIFYGSVKAAAKINAPNARTIYEDLSARFPHSERQKKA